MSNTFCIKAWWQQQCGICCCFYEQPSNMVYGGWELYISSVPFTLLFRTQEKGTPLLPLLSNSFWPFFLTQEKGLSVPIHAQILDPGEGSTRHALVLDPGEGSTYPCLTTGPRRRVFRPCPTCSGLRRSVRMKYRFQMWIDIKILSLLFICA